MNLGDKVANNYILFFNEEALCNHFFKIFQF